MEQLEQKYIELTKSIKSLTGLDFVEAEQERQYVREQLNEEHQKKNFVVI